MGTTPSVAYVEPRLGSDRINKRPSRNVHHAIRLARSIEFPLNLFVTLNFWQTAISPRETDRGFRKVREAFRKWVRRPNKDARQWSVPPSYVWVIENPGNSGHIHVHWALHVPSPRQKDFAARLRQWVEAAAGDFYSDTAIDIRPTWQGPLGLERYMLKGLHKPLCEEFKIEHSDQGFVYGKRIGHSRNLGPVQLAMWVELGAHRRPMPWRKNKYSQPQTADPAFSYPQLSI